MNKQFIRECKAAAIASNEIITSCWSAIAMELNRCKWSSDEITELVNEVQELWSGKTDQYFINEITAIGIPILDLVGYYEKNTTAYGKRHRASHLKAKETCATLLACCGLVCKEKYGWSANDVSMMIYNTVYIWNDAARMHLDIQKICADTTGYDFRYKVV